MAHPILSISLKIAPDFSTRLPKYSKLPFAVPHKNTALNSDVITKMVLSGGVHTPPTAPPLPLPSPWWSKCIYDKPSKDDSVRKSFLFNISWIIMCLYTILPNVSGNSVHKIHISFIQVFVPYNTYVTTLYFQLF